MPVKNTEPRRYCLRCFRTSSHCLVKEEKLQASNSRAKVKCGSLNCNRTVSNFIQLSENTRLILKYSQYYLICILELKCLISEPLASLNRIIKHYIINIIQEILVTLYNTGALMCINSSLTNAQIIMS